MPNAVAPALAHQGQKGLHIEPFAWAALSVAERKPATKDHLRDTFGVANSMSNG